MLHAVPWKSSQLWKMISTTKGPLQLPWTDVLTWAHADHERATEPYELTDYVPD